MAMNTDTMAAAARRSSRGWWLPAGVFAVVLLAQWPLLFNPGYFSHDELQWAAFAQRGTTVGWFDLDVFQYRPLTFNLWLWLSHGLFDTPQLFHALLVAWGSVNAVLLYTAGRRFGMQAWPAAFGAAAFALGPYAAYTHGWIGTLGDLLWLSCALLAVLGTQLARSHIAAAVWVALWTACGLLSKEAALAIPALLAVAWWFDERKPRWLVVAIASGTIAAFYLALRLEVLLYMPREGAQYTIGLANVPLRWLEYQLFPPIFPLLEVFTTFRRGFGWPLVIATLLWLGMCFALWQAGNRLLALFLFGGIAALAPVLPMASSWNQYAYGFAAVTAMCIAAAWPHTTRVGRFAITVFATLVVLHGAVVMLRMYQVGRVQSVFSPALADAVEHHRAATPLRLRIGDGAKDWIFRRLTHDIPEYQGVAIGERVRLVGDGETAEYVIEADGHLIPLR